LGLPVDDRRYDVAGQIIEKLGLRAVHLLTNNPHKCASLQSALSIPVYTLPLPSTVNPFNRAYLKAKLEKMGHSLELPEENSL
jgi:3,4-dihydroxy 2-butanone 4-phosphate synthase/GTP cyclohydrolase II